ncbi:MAG: ABC-type transport auxiliary lipoprotein family protein [Burkholderiales bacterium]|mgnify:CR=1 FL=1|jgi:cholesterol transport system auxiliary component|nr:ABC-type transport auxiliary lipoprotein family protein [Burkholderiales bacterium]
MKPLAAITGSLLLLLGGCASFGPQEAQRHYVIEVPPAQAKTTATPRTTTLLVAPATVSGFYETQDIVYSRAPGMRAYYQFHSWTERPGRRLSELLVMRLERAGSFSTVATVVSGVKGQLVLGTHLAEFYHDAATAPGSVKVTITAELTDPVRRVLLARRSFERSAPAATYDAPGAVQAFNMAVTALLDEIAAWVEVAAPR